MRTVLRLRPIGIVLGLLTLALPAPARAQHAGLGGGFGGGDKPEPPVQFVLIGRRPAHPLPAPVARAWLKLQKAVDLDFPQETPLEDVLAFIKEATAEAKDGKDEDLRLYVDPVGLQECEKTMSSPVIMSMKGVSVSAALQLMLKQLGMAFNVQKDGIVVITSGASEDRTEYSVPVTAAAARAWLKLHRPTTLAFQEAPLSDVIKAIKQATADKDSPSGLPIYVDPEALKGADKTMSSPITLNLEGIPLATSLALIARQVGLVFRVQEDGIVMIQQEEEDEEDPLPPGHGAETIAILRARLEEAKMQAEIARYKAIIEDPKANIGGGFRSVPAR
jgi:hypothetical protein